MTTTLGLKDLARPVTQYVRQVETTLGDELTVGEALAVLRTRNVEHKIIYFYVVDADNRLVGVMPTRTLLLSDTSAQIAAVMQKPVISVPASADLELAMDMFATHRLLALPVVDDDNRLQGMIDIRLYSDELFEMAEHNRAADLFQLIGLSVQELREGTAGRAFRMRMPWLGCNLVGGVVCAIIAAAFDDVLAAVLVLAMFIPLVLTLAESVSVQAVTLVLHSLHAPGEPWRRLRQRLTLEWKTAACLGVASGLIVGVAALAWGQGVHPPAVIAVSIAISIIIAATLGTIVPFLLHMLRLDPKVAAGPVVLMATDVITLSTYLSLGTWWLL